MVQYSTTHRALCLLALAPSCGIVPSFHPPSPYPSFTYSTLTIRSDPIWNNSFGCWGERIRNKARGVTLTHTTRRRELSIYIQIRTGQKSCNIKKGGEDFCVHYTTPSLLSAVEPTLPFIISSDKAFKQPRNENVNQESINHHRQRLLLLLPHFSLLLLFPYFYSNCSKLFFYFFDKLTRPYIVKVLATRVYGVDDERPVVWMCHNGRR